MGIKDRIRGDYIGTTWGDFLVRPGIPASETPFTPEDVDISTYIDKDRKVRLQKPLISAGMRSITDKDLGLEVGKAGGMGVAPRGLTIEREAEIVEHVKKNKVKVGDIESLTEPTTVRDNNPLGIAIAEAKKTGHTNIPVVGRKAEFMGMFRYRPSVHDSMDLSMPISHVMMPYNAGGESSIHVCRSRMSDSKIKKYLEEKNLRWVPVIDGYGRFDRLVFLQKDERYKVGAAIDTHKGWEKRVEKVLEAGADMLFIDMSDAQKWFPRDLIRHYTKFLNGYKKTFGDYVPICGGNIAVKDGFRYLVEAGADAIKHGMGPGSICSTNSVLGVGMPPFDSQVELVDERDQYFEDTGGANGGIYIPLIADGGLDGTDNIVVALAADAQAVMLGKMMGCFYESAADRVDRVTGALKKKGEIGEDQIKAMKIYGEASKEAFETTGDMKRYTTPLSNSGTATFQGVSGTIPYGGRVKPGVENYTRALQEAIYHAGFDSLETFGKNAVVTRLSERAKETARPHGINIISD